MIKEKAKALSEMFPEEIASVEAGDCPICRQAIDHNSFRDQVSRKEFEISGMCQGCQDKIFNEDQEIPFSDPECVGCDCSCGCEFDE